MFKESLFGLIVFVSRFRGTALTASASRSSARRVGCHMGGEFLLLIHIPSLQIAKSVISDVLQH
jgi:hypothetical protein